MTEKANSKNIFTTLALLAFLILFPLLSWFYLKKGFDYQKEARAELKDYGQLAEFSLKKDNGNVFNLDSLEGKLAVIAFIGKDAGLNNKIVEIVSKLETQFEDSKGLQLMNVVLHPDALSNNSVLKTLEKFPIKSGLLTSDSMDLQKWLGTAIKIPTSRQADGEDTFKYLLRQDVSGQIADYPYFVLVDAKNTIRNFYRVNTESEVKRMVEHIAMIMPRAPERDIILKRENEK